ncbi:MAG: flippase-like domain-containing protein [Bacteroidetes bacterium]|nr:flippase-like domain-containing protein [Bacteroidota bacterium]
MRKIVISIIQFIVSISLGVFLIWYVYKDLTGEQREEIYRSFSGADYTWVILSVILGIISHFLRALRWNLLIETIGTKPILLKSTAAVMVGYLANYALPRIGEVARCGVLSRYEKLPFDKLVGTVIIERAVDLCITLILTLILFIAELDVIGNFMAGLLGPFIDKVPSSSALFFLFSGTILFLIALGYFILKRTSAGKRGILFLEGIIQGIRSITRLNDKGRFIIYSILIWFLYYAMFHICLFCLPETSVVPFWGAVAGFIMGGYGIILVQGGIGAFPALVMATLSLYGIPGEYGFAFGWILWTAQTAMILVAGTISIGYLMLISKTKIKQNEPH